MTGYRSGRRKGPARRKHLMNLLERLDGEWIRMRRDGGPGCYVSRHWRMRNGFQMKWFFRVSDQLHLMDVEKRGE